jgi:hypothetical protein
MAGSPAGTNGVGRRRGLSITDCATVWISAMKERILKKFYDEIAILEREVKVDLPKEIQRARELGDLRENAEYKAAEGAARTSSTSASPC